MTPARNEERDRMLILQSENKDYLCMEKKKKEET